MSHLNEDPRTLQDSRPVPSADMTRERRQWVRFVFPELVTRLSWVDGMETITHLVNLVNVSANGVAVIIEVKPPTNRPCTILFNNGGVLTGPIPASVISVENTQGNRYFVRMRFDPVPATESLSRHQKERRAWQRVIPRERRASLSWQVNDHPIAVPGDTQDISGGGIAVKTEVSPPWNQAIWLSIGPAGEDVGPVECRLVGVQPDQAGKIIARLAFVDLCPLDLYHVALGDSK